MHEHLIIVVVVTVVIVIVVIVVVVIVIVVVVVVVIIVVIVVVVAVVIVDVVVVVVVVDAAIGEILLRLGRLAVVLGIMALWPRDGRGLTASLLHHGCMIPLLAIKFFARGAPCPDFLVSLHPFDWIE